MAECSRPSSFSSASSAGPSLSSSSSIANQIDIPDEPHHPKTFNYPYRSFGTSKPVRRCFQPSWFDRFSWIHYKTEEDAVVCFSCCKAVKSGKVRESKITENTFLTGGFTNWKDATRQFTKHES